MDPYTREKERQEETNSEGTIDMGFPESPRNKTALHDHSVRSLGVRDSGLAYFLWSNPAKNTWEEVWIEWAKLQHEICVSALPSSTYV